MGTGVYCPKCHREMVQRKAKKPPYRTFYGCPAFFPKSDRNIDGFDADAGEKQCDGVTWIAVPKQSPVVKVAAPKIKGSPQQLAIWREMEFGTSHLMVKALAGTGKTTTIVIGAEKLKGTIIAVAFNNKIARELDARMPERVVTCTFHALGWRAIKAIYGKNLQINKYKSHNIADKLLPEDMEDSVKNSIKFNAAKLVSLCKNRLVEPTEANLTKLCDRYKVECNGEQDKIFELVPKILKIAAESTTDFDFDDQIWIPTVRNLSLGTYDNVMVDETQDLNPCRVEMMFRIAGKNGRIIVVGDSNQSIMGFSGADCECMENLEARLSAA